MNSLEFDRMVIWRTSLIFIDVESFLCYYYLHVEMEEIFSSERAGRNYRGSGKISIKKIVSLPY